MHRILTAALTAAALVAGTATAAEFPSRPIRFIVPFTAGTGMDNIARRVGEKLGPKLGQPVVVENRTGTSGHLGAEAVARSAPDGHTLLVTASNISITATLYAAASTFDAMKDLVPMTIAGWGNATLVTTPKLKATTLAEVLALAKASPGKITFASAGVGSPSHMNIEQFQQVTGTQFLHVPYKGTGPAVSDLIAGHVDLMFVATHTVMPYVTSGKVRAIAVASQNRHKAAPQLESFGELGIKEFTTDAWYGFLAPKDTPAPILEQLTNEIRTILLLPDVKASLEKTGLQIDPTTPQAMRAIMTREYNEYGEIIRKNKITPE